MTMQHAMRSNDVQTCANLVYKRRLLDPCQRAIRGRKSRVKKTQSTVFVGGEIKQTISTTSKSFTAPSNLQFDLSPSS